jgi:hypothetical protein
VREDLPFWIKTLAHLTKLDYKNIEMVKLDKLITCVTMLDDELMELDFSSLIEYLKEVRGHLIAMRTKGKPPGRA